MSDLVARRELRDPEIPGGKVRPAAYPKDLKKRAKVNELMDWFNTHFYHDYAYGVVYPQVFPHHKRPSEELQKGTIAWGKEQTKRLAAGAERPLSRQGEQISRPATRSPSPIISARRC